MSESSPTPHSIEQIPSLEQRRARYRAELQEIFRHERDRIPNAVLVTEYDLILACARQNYPAQLVSQIRDELQKMQLVKHKTPRRLTQENLVELRKSTQHILRRPDILELYSALADAIAKQLHSRIKVNDLTRRDSRTSGPLSV